MDSQKEKMCKKCGAVKPRTEFHRRKQSSDGLQYRCKKCHSRAVVVSRKQIDMKWELSKQEHAAEPKWPSPPPLHGYRCEECEHSAMVQAGNMQDVCPKCGSAFWGIG